MPTFDVTVTGRIAITYPVNAPEEDDARDAYVDLAALVQTHDQGVGSDHPGVRIVLIPDSFDYAQADAAPANEDLPDTAVAHVVPAEEEEE